jgi:flagellar motility protein MotE (MotC chaperone)
MENNEPTIISDEILNKINRLENKYLEMKKEFKEIKERFAKLEKTKVIF